MARVRVRREKSGLYTRDIRAQALDLLNGWDRGGASRAPRLGRAEARLGRTGRAVARLGHAPRALRNRAAGPGCEGACKCGAGPRKGAMDDFQFCTVD